MEFGQTDDQRQLQDSVDRFVRERYSFESWRTFARADAGFSEENWRAMADLGWLAVAVPEAYGGLGLSVRERAVIMESFGRGLVLEPYWSTAVLGAELLLACGSEAQCQDFLPKLAEGRLKLAVALTEPGARFEWTHIRCRAERSGDGYRLNGRKIAVLDAPAADRLLVLARTGGAWDERAGLSLFWVGRDTPRITRRDFRTVDERRCSDLVFDDVQLHDAQLIGVEGAAADVLERAIDHAIAALCSEAVGAMTRLVEMTVDYLKTRKQFGRPLAEFQALRHRVADMVMATEQSRSLATLCSLHLEDGPKNRSYIAAAAKSQIGTAGRFVGQNAVQLHGGIGVTDELPIGHLLKRLMAIDTMLGDTSFHLKRIADHIEV